MNPHHLFLVKSLASLCILGLDISTTVFALENNAIAENFDATTVWSYGSQNGGNAIISNNTAENYLNSRGSLKANYPIASGGVYNWAHRLDL